MKSSPRPLAPASIDSAQLAAVSGGMQWQDFRRSTNVEDRRPAAAVARDNQWWNQQHSVPLPPRRPPGI